MPHNSVVIRADRIAGRPGNESRSFSGAAPWDGMAGKSPRMSAAARREPAAAAQNGIVQCETWARYVPAGTPRMRDTVCPPITVDSARPRLPGAARAAAAEDAAGANRPAAAAAMMRPASVMPYDRPRPQTAFPAAKSNSEPASNRLLSARRAIAVRTGEPTAYTSE